MPKTKSGFTIVELLIVIVVIAILAAISIVAYNGVQNRTNDSAVQADLSTSAKLLALYRAEHGRFPASITELEEAKIKVTKGSYHAIAGRANFYYCVDVNNPAQYALGAVSKSLQGYYIANGSLIKSSGSNNVWGATTCSQIGLTSSDSNVWTPSGWVGGPAEWLNWVS